MGSVYESGWEDTVREGVDKQHSSNMLSLSLSLSPTPTTTTTTHHVVTESY